ncbi:MAG: hypothetical protein BGO10_08050 [Chlamydia sp. 32-24]|nr:MAG: hypothetical protein BGO10_08050 [Chlamydia sp. 32-24]
MKKFTAVLSLAILGVFAVYIHKQIYPKELSSKTISKPKELEIVDLATVDGLLKQDRIEEAASIVSSHLFDATPTLLENRWAEIGIEIAQKEHNLPVLLKLYSSYPKIFEKNELASILLADFFLLQNDTNNLEKIRDSWRGKEIQENKWFLIDVDTMLYQGKTEEALQLLHRFNFEGKSDADRYLRLAFIYFSEHPHKAWEFLEVAKNIDPLNPHIHTYMGLLSEAAGEKRVANKEFETAAKLQPNNVYLQDQLAEFYVRNKQLALAYPIWQKMTQFASADLLWSKALFWDKVYKPLTPTPNITKIPKGKMHSFVEYLLTLDKNEFWNETAYNNVQEGFKWKNQEQSIYWLNLLQTLKEGSDQKAWELVHNKSFQEEIWDHDLDLALKYVLAYKLRRPMPTERFSDNANPFFQSLTSLHKSDEHIYSPLNSILENNYIYSFLFLAADWNEAALRLSYPKQNDSYLPEWISYKYTEALTKNRSDLDALEYALIQSPMPSLDILIGKLFLKKGNKQSALVHFERAAIIENETGKHAAWLATKTYLDDNSIQMAKKMIEYNRLLANSVLGKETLAQIAIKEGDNKNAEEIYLSIIDHSNIAKSYLAKKAYEEKNWQKAKELTAYLLKANPDHPLLKENYDKIIAEEKKELQKIGH